MSSGCLNFTACVPPSMDKMIADQPEPIFAADLNSRVARVPKLSQERSLATWLRRAGRKKSSMLSPSADVVANARQRSWNEVKGQNDECTASFVRSLISSRREFGITRVGTITRLDRV